MDESKSGFPIPEDIEFVEYMGKQSKKAASHKKGKVHGCIMDITFTVTPHSMHGVYILHVTPCMFNRER